MRPPVAEDMVLVRVKVCAVAPLDGAVRRGDFEHYVGLPTVPGYAISGVVERLGVEVDRFKVGDEVVGNPLLPLPLPPLLLTWIGWQPSSHLILEVATDNTWL